MKNHDMAPGDRVALTIPIGYRPDGAVGTVLEVGRRVLMVRFDHPAPNAEQVAAVAVHEVRRLRS